MTVWKQKTYTNMVGGREIFSFAECYFHPGRNALGYQDGASIKIIALIWECYAAGCTKTGPQILRSEKIEKKRTRKSPKRAKPGAFWVLERMGRLGENGKRFFTFSTDLSRLPARSACGTRFWSGCGRV